MSWRVEDDQWRVPCQSWRSAQRLRATMTTAVQKGLHLPFIFVCMSDDCASQNQRVINAVTWAEFKYQSLSRVEDRNFSTKSHWPWTAGPDQSRVFSEHVPRCLWHETQHLKDHRGRFLRLLMFFGDVQLAARSWGEPGTHCREDVTHLALEYLRIISEELREESGCTMFPCRNCCSQWPGGR